MIKRRFYKYEHGDGDDHSDSSSSDSEVEPEASEDSEEEDDVVVEARDNSRPASSSSGYESEDSSTHEVDLDEEGMPANNGNVETTTRQDAFESLLTAKNKAKVDNVLNTEVDKDKVSSAISNCVLKCKSVFKCKLCPRIVCLSEETLNAHLKSKRHARSEKLLRDGRLKLMLNSDGKIEGDANEEIQPNKNPSKSRKKGRGRQRQKKRLMKKREASTMDKAIKSEKKPGKKRRKSEG